MEKRRRLMMYIIAAEVLMIMVNLLAFVPADASAVTGQVVGEEVVVEDARPVSKVKIAFIDILILVAVLGIFVYAERR